MDIKYLVFVCLFVISSTQAEEFKRGFILTAPKVLEAGSTNQLLLTIINGPDIAEVKVRLLKAENDDVLTESIVSITQKNLTNFPVEFFVPPLSVTNARLHLQGIFELDGYQINSVKEIHIRSETLVIFAETDKPVYKPGQLVKFRILPVDTLLRPVQHSKQNEIWIEDPTGIRVAQWDNVPTEGGIIQEELQLSSEPVLGMWALHTAIYNTTYVKHFEIRKYVLPKFEVTVTPPSYLLATAEQVVWKVCASYTYGKPVEGSLDITVGYKRLLWEPSDYLLPKIHLQMSIQGCQLVRLSSSELFLKKRELYYRMLELHAEVTEHGTGVKQKATGEVKITHNPVEIKYLEAENGPQYFKPGLPYKGTILVTTPDGVPSPGEIIKLCLSTRNGPHDFQEKYCINDTGSENGLIHFSLPAVHINSDVSHLLLEATAIEYPEIPYDKSGYVLSYQPYSIIRLRKWFSPSNSYIQIEPIATEIPCGEMIPVTVSFTVTNDINISLVYQVMSRGQMIEYGSKDIFLSQLSDFSENSSFNVSYLNNDKGTTDQKKTLLPLRVMKYTFMLSSRTSVSPMVRLIVFYIRDDGEVVADSQEIKIVKCLLHRVKLKFGTQKSYPGSETSVRLEASPHAVCGVGIVDKSVDLLKRGNALSKEKIFEILQKYDLNRNTLPHQITDTYCENKIAKEGGVEDFEHPLLKGFPVSWFRYMSENVDSMMAFEEVGMVVLTDLKVEARDCSRSPIALPVLGFNEERLGVKVKNFFSKDRGRALTLDAESKQLPSLPSSQPPKSVVEIRNYFPETWLWELYNVPGNGKLVLKQTVPHTITEWVGNAVCIVPDKGLGISDPTSLQSFQPFFSSFTVPYSVIRHESAPVKVSVFNYLSQCLPIKLSLEVTADFKLESSSPTKKICVCGGKSVTHTFRIQPVKLGKVNITVYSYSMWDSNVCGNETKTEVFARDAVTRQLLVEVEGFPREHTKNFFFCPRDHGGIYDKTIDLLLPDDVVDGSPRAYFSVTGDLMGPTLQGLDKLVRLPTGCGEQNMVLFAPNIFVLEYLKSSGRLTEEIKTKVISHMETGYQQELTYRHKDGSYSAFGIKDPEGSIWLTAFVLKSFARAQNFITVDQKDLARSTKWITKQQLENGCFHNTGKVLHKGMKGGVGRKDGSLAPLTAYVLISLMEAGFKNYSKLYDDALFCLRAESDLSSYSLALFSYATALAKLPQAEEYYQMLEERAVSEGNLKYWKEKQGNSLSLNVETAGYAILSLLEMGGVKHLSRALPILRWVTLQRNSNGGFVSTQDTVVALQALAKYATLAGQHIISMNILLQGDSLEHNFELNQKNFAVMQTLKVPVLPTSLDVSAVGLGCALIQASLRYNVKQEFKSDTLELLLKVKPKGSHHCNDLLVNVCMRYAIPGETSNMAVLEFKLLSGYTADEESLIQLQEKSLGLKRHEVSESQVNFYFEELMNEQMCIKFYMKQEFVVENLLPATVKLYDYYEQEISISKNYTIHPLCNLHPLSKPLPTELSSNSSILTEQNQSEIEAQSETVVQATSDKKREHRNENEIFPRKAKALLQSGNVELPKHISHFTNVDHELDLPGSDEANAPVTYLPLSEFMAMRDQSPLSCPHCLVNLPTNFSKIYCSSAFAFLVFSSSSGNESLRIVHDLNPTFSKPENLEGFADIEISRDCKCAPLRNGPSPLLVMGNLEFLWTSTGSKHHLTLRDGVYVIKLSSNFDETQGFKDIQLLCMNKDP